MTTSQLAFLLFGLLWLLTFTPAWFFFGKLVIYSFNLKTSLKSVKFWGCLVVYIFIIILPYLPLFIFGEDFSGLLSAFIAAALLLAISMPLARIFLAKRIEKILWGIYGYVYDGLRHFYPYTHLVDMAVKRLDVQPENRVLDLGCGTGNASELIIQHNPKFLYAVDGSSSMLRPARRKLAGKPCVKISKLDAVEYLKLTPSKSIDKILMINVIYAVHNRDELWQEIMRVVNTNAKIVMTSSDRGGSFAIIKEHLRHGNPIMLLHPKLIAVFIVDSLISTIASTGSFHFISQQEMIDEIQKSGGAVSDVKRCYGGKKDGVNLMMTVTKAFNS